MRKLVLLLLILFSINAYTQPNYIHTDSIHVERFDESYAGFRYMIITEFESQRDSLTKLIAESFLNGYGLSILKQEINDNQKNGFQYFIYNDIVVIEPKNMIDTAITHEDKIRFTTACVQLKEYYELQEKISKYKPNDGIRYH